MSWCKNMIKEIGGFFELELNKKEEYHSKAIKLNAGRYCLQYIFKTKKYEKIYIPYYICNSILQTIIEENLQYEFYNINHRFEPSFDKKINEKECLLYVNYFGINAEIVNKICTKFNNVIIDNTQAFFEKPILNSDTIYSPRKFFGVPDGGYLYTDKILQYELEQDLSYSRCEYLLKRIDVSSNKSYDLFKKNEEMLTKYGMKNMSKLTQSILLNINYEQTRDIRNSNFLHLHDNLKNYNELDININNINGPMVYPLLIRDDMLREKLINNRIYIATYWNEVENRVNKDSFEYLLLKNLIPLPIDQRYGKNEMNYIVKIILS